MLGRGRVMGKLKVQEIEGGRKGFCELEIGGDILQCILPGFDAGLGLRVTI